MNDVKWIFIPRERHLHHFSSCFRHNIVQYAAKRSAIWCKTHCVLVLNAVRFGAKRKVKWCKTQCKIQLNARQKHKYPLQMYKQYL